MNLGAITRAEVLQYIESHPWRFGDINNPLDALIYSQEDLSQATAHFYNVPGVGMVQYDSSNGQLFMTDNPFGMASVGQETVTELQGENLTPTQIQTQQGGWQDQIAPYVIAIGQAAIIGGALSEFYSLYGAAAEVGTGATFAGEGSLSVLNAEQILALENAASAAIAPIDFSSTLFTQAGIGSAATGAAAFESGFVNSSVIADSFNAGTLGVSGASTTASLLAAAKDGASIVKAAASVGSLVTGAGRKNNDIIIPGTNIYPGNTGSIADFTRPALIVAALAGLYFLGKKQ